MWREIGILRIDGVRVYEYEWCRVCNCTTRSETHLEYCAALRLLDAEKFFDA